MFFWSKLHRETQSMRLDVEASPHDHVLFHVRACGQIPVAVAMTPMRWKRGQSVHQSTSLAECGAHCQESQIALLIGWCSKHGRARVKVRHRPL